MEETWRHLRHETPERQTLTGRTMEREDSHKRYSNMEIFSNYHHSDKNINPRDHLRLPRENTPQLPATSSVIWYTTQAGLQLICNRFDILYPCITCIFRTKTKIIIYSYFSLLLPRREGKFRSQVAFPSNARYFRKSYFK